MCGRIACLLDPQTICHACAPQQPQWRDASSGAKYYPGANKMPTSYCPIMYRPEGAQGKELVIEPMMWGIIPRWHKGEPTKHGLSSNNARIETIETSKLYSRLIPTSRCILLAQGFYEWKTAGAKKGAPKEPFFIFSDSAPVKVKQEEDEQKQTLREQWNDPANFDEKSGTWYGPPLLKMAGLYDVWKHGEGGEESPVHSFTVITMESNESLSWLHDRMPAILETQEQCDAWLNGADLKTTLKQAKKLKHYAVDAKVNNSRCHDEDCMDPKGQSKTEGKAKGEANFMANWLKRPAKGEEAKVKEEEEADESEGDEGDEEEDEASGDEEEDEEEEKVEVKKSKKSGVKTTTTGKKK